MNIISTPDAPIPAGHYSQAIVHNGFIFVAGQVPINPVTREKILGSIEEQTEQVINNVEAIVNAAGSDLAHIVKVTVYVADIALWDTVNSVYAKRFGSHKPARAIVPTKELHHGFLIEMDAIAVLKESTP